MRRLEIVHQFVEAVPDEPAEGILYISMTAAKAVYRCGCGAIMATPLGRRGWKLEFDGFSISLKPPIDYWTVKCGSRYQIRRNRVRWLAQCSLPDAETGGFLASLS